MSILWLLSKSKEFTCFAKPQDYDPLVNVADKFNFIFPIWYIGEHQFVTCHSYKNQMENQALLFSALSHDCAFWAYVCDKKRIASLPIHREVEDFIRFGIPPELRSKMWQALAGVSLTAEDIAKYHELSRIENESFSYLINRDIDRTFEISDPTFIQKLSRVLTAYSNHNLDVGYCQSMNILAATLLIFMQEEHAFTMLVYIIEELLPNFHSESMSGYLAAEEIFKFLLAVELPELHFHFQKIHYDISAVTISWFLSLFVHSMPHVTAFVMWDNIFLKGPNGIYEVGLAILRMLQRDLLQIDNYSDMMLYVPKRLKELYNPNKVLKHMKSLSSEQVQAAKDAIARMQDEITRAEETIKNRFSTGTPFKHAELKDLWIQYVAKFPFLCNKNTGLDYKFFSQFISGTFSEWYLDRELLEHLFQMLDLNQDGVIDFPELACFLYVMCRSSFEEFTEFNLRLFDVEQKGWLDKSSLTRMIRSMYGMFQSDSQFKQFTEHFAKDIFDFPALAFSGTITKDTFRDVVEVQPQILERLIRRNPEVKINPKNTFFFWMSLFLTPRQNTEMIHITFKLQNDVDLSVPPNVTFSASSA